MLTFHQKKPMGWFKNSVKEDKSLLLCYLHNRIKCSVNTHIMQLTYSKNKMESYKQIQYVKKFEYDK